MTEAIGQQYDPIRSHTLQAIHLIAFVHKSIAHHCSVATSAAVATGTANTLGNKGAVAIYIVIGKTKLLIANAHLAAHQNAEKQRNSDFNKINRLMPSLLERKEINILVSKKENLRLESKIVKSSLIINDELEVKQPLINESRKIRSKEEIIVDDKNSDNNNNDSDDDDDIDNDKNDNIEYLDKISDGSNNEKIDSFSPIRDAADNNNNNVNKENDTIQSRKRLPSALANELNERTEGLPTLYVLKKNIKI